MPIEITPENVEGTTWYRVNTAYFPFLTNAILAALSVGMNPVLKEEV